MHTARYIYSWMILSFINMAAFSAHAETVYYTLENVILGDGTQMTGTFSWTFDVGDQAIRINAFYSSSTLVPATKKPPRFRNMLFKDITCEGAARAVEITGLEEAPVRDLRFENVSISGNQGFIATDAENIYR